MEHFRFWGLAEKLRAAPRDAGRITHGDRGGLWRPHGRVLARSRPGASRSVPTSSRATSACPSTAPRRCCASALAEQETVGTATSGGRPPAIEQDDRGVRVDRRPGAASSKVLEAEYVVGCDGGRSVVAAQSGVQRRGSDFDQCWSPSPSSAHPSSNRDPRPLSPPLHLPGGGALTSRATGPFFGRVDAERDLVLPRPDPGGGHPGGRRTSSRCSFLGRSVSGVRLRTRPPRLLGPARPRWPQEYRVGSSVHRGGRCPHATPRTAASGSTTGSRTPSTSAGN